MQPASLVCGLRMCCEYITAFSPQYKHTSLISESVTGKGSIFTPTSERVGSAQVGRPPLLTKEVKSQVLSNTFFLARDGQELGGGFFFAPGKAVIAYHDMEQHQR